jgi:ectoine hydroxylase-related dioxygenase (phytanoyl-CoA dioxygenase family)
LPSGCTVIPDQLGATLTLTTDDVGRAVIFLEDWKSGHYFEIDEVPIVNWKKGDYILWKNDTSHMAANLGKENRYTMQVTGIVL